MSLADQSQQWFPTSVQVTVFQARNLRIKGKNGTNDAYAIMQVAKDKFSTSVAEKSVLPVWKEEATFELPHFHLGEPERCTLYVTVMHRALVGLDKLLGQAVIDLRDLHENRSRNKTEWFKLLDKNGKPDKERGEVLLDIQFMRNNLTASMFDLSVKDKPRSRVSKLKDKIRGKKKDGFSDSASAIVPSVAQVMTDSDEERSSHSGSPGTKKKSKLKSLFGPKSNLQRNVSQSMSTLGTLPERNSSLSGSRSSGLNVDSPEAKNKFKFLTHKRTGSSDSRTSLGPFSLLGRSKQVTNEQSNLCINGSHVYAEEPETKGSTLSLASSTQGSVEDVRRIPERNPSDASVDSLKSLTLPSYRAESKRKALPEENVRQAEERRKAEAEKLQEDRARLEEQIKQREEEERQKLEEQKKEQEEERRRQEEARQAEERKRQEEIKRCEELKQQEESSVTGRLTSLLGIGRKKDEQPAAFQEKRASREFEAPPRSDNPFEEIPLSPESLNPLEENPQKGVRAPQTATSGFPNRTVKVSAVKPRLVVSQKAEPNQGQPPSPPANTDPSIKSPLPSSPSFDSTLSSAPSDSPDTFSDLHSSLAPPKARKSSDSFRGSRENLAASESPMDSTGQKQRVLLHPGQLASSKNQNRPPTYGGATLMSAKTETSRVALGASSSAPRGLSTKTTVTSGYLPPVTEVAGTGNSEALSSQHPPLPLPDYDSLFPKRRHGVQGQFQWDQVVTEVNIRRKFGPNVGGREMSVDSPDLSQQGTQGLEQDGISELRDKRMENTNSGKFSRQRSAVSRKQPIVAPKPSITTPLKPTSDVIVKEASTNKAGPVVDKPNQFASRVFATTSPNAQNTNVPLAKPRALVENERKVLSTSVDISSGKDLFPEETSKSGQNLSQVSVLPSQSSKELPLVKPRQKSLTKGQVENIQAEEKLSTSVIQNSVPKTRDSKVLDKVPVEKNLNKANVTDLSSNTPVSFAKTPKSPPRFFMKTSSMPNEDFVREDSVKISLKEEKLFEQDPFPNDAFLSMDPWALPSESKNDLFGGVKMKENTHIERMSEEDIDRIFGNKEADPFADFDHRGSAESPEKPKLSVRKSPEHSTPFQMGISSNNKKAFLPPTKAGNTQEMKSNQTFQDQHSEEDLMAPVYPVRDVKMESEVQDPFSVDQQDGPVLHNRRDLFSTDAFSLLEYPVNATDEGTNVSSGGKTLVRAWVSPSETQFNTGQGSSGGGPAGKAGEPASTPRRPHPVKPMSTVESQLSTSSLLGWDNKPTDTDELKPGKMKGSTAVGSGPYSQLTQEELVTLVVKQQAELSKKDSKIIELEEYIDNLLVRVIDEKPSILMAVNSSKQAF